MRSVLMIVIGVALALAFDAVAAAFHKRGAMRAVDGGRWFIGAWLAVTIVDFYVGVSTGHAASLELVVHALVFTVPAALGWYLSRRRRAPPAPSQ